MSLVLTLDFTQPITLSETEYWAVRRARNSVRDEYEKSHDPNKTRRLRNSIRALDTVLTGYERENPHVRDQRPEEHYPEGQLELTLSFA